MARLLDLFSCEGGAARGYQRAGFHVTGVDLEGRFAKRYAGDVFVQADAIEYVKEHGHEFDAIHASPPCQRFTHGNAGSEAALKHPDLIAPTRDALIATGKPYVIENVPRSPLEDPLVLCGSMFNLSTVDDDGTPLHLKRHRHFESNLPLVAPAECDHTLPEGAQWAGSYGGARKDKWEARHVRKGGYVPARHVQERLLGIDWMTQHGMHQSLPPVYTEWIRRQLMEAL